MSEEKNKNGAPQHAEFERQDLTAKSVVIFLVVLAVIGIASHIVLTGMYGYLDRYEQAHQPPQNPLVPKAEADTRRASTEDEQKFPQPRLETDERGELSSVRSREEQTLNSYGWVDEKAGTVRIPIERAMELTAQRGLPVRPMMNASGKKE
jgi:hypothetical protein